MLQTPQVETRTFTRKPKSTAIQRAFIRLDALNCEWVALIVGGNEKRFDKLCELIIDLALKIIRMPAQSSGDMLIKIAAAGALLDRQDSRSPLPTWNFKPSGYCVDDAGGTLLMSLRDDLNRILEGI